MKPPTESLPGCHSKKASFSLDGKKYASFHLYKYTIIRPQKKLLFFTIFRFF